MAEPIFKSDLYRDADLSSVTTQVGDILMLTLPGEPSNQVSQYTVLEKSQIDAGNHPETGEHHTMVVLRLQKVV